MINFIVKKIITLVCCSLMLVHCVYALGQGVIHPAKLVDADVGISIDGKLTEEVWADLAVYKDLKIAWPSTMETPAFGTEVRFFYTEKGLYVGAYCEVPADKQIKRLSLRDDAFLLRDEFQLALDASGKGLYGYVFSLYLGGSKTDGTLTLEIEREFEWDGPWSGQTTETEQGWYAEMFLPWSMMNISASDSKKQMGIFFSRRVGHLGERWSWPAIPHYGSRFLSDFQPFEIESINAKYNYTFYPYVSFLQDRINDTDKSRAGFDLFWNPSPSMQLSATISPDFGQVEMDDIVINFSAIEPFIPEKRPFFLEGRDVFDPGLMNLVFTRRIGEYPDTPISKKELDRNGYDYAAEGLAEKTELDGAMKVVGQSGNWRYGVLGAVEEDSDYRITDSESLALIDEGTMKGRKFGVARLVYEQTGADFKALGFMSTMVKHYYGDAKVNAVDANFRSPKNIWEVKGQLAQSDVLGLKGMGFLGLLGYQASPAENHLFELEYFDEDFDFNDFGFMQRNEIFSFDYKYVNRETNIPGLINRETRFTWRQGYNSGSHRLVMSGYEFARQWEYTDQSVFNAGGEYSPSRWDDTSAYDNGDYRIQDRLALWLGWKSDQSRPFSYGTEVRWNQEQLQGNTYETNLTLNYRPVGNISINFKLGYTHSEDWIIYKGGKRLVGYDSRELSPRLNASIFFTEKQQLDIRFQWVGLKAKARNNYRINSGERLESSYFDDKGNLYDPRSDDFELSDLAFQLRYKYEIAPLSDLFIVYVRGGRRRNINDEFTNRGFGYLLEDMLHNPSSDQFIVKLRYRFGG